MDLDRILATLRLQFVDFSPVVAFDVRGTPATAGSKRAFVNKTTGKPFITDDCKRGKEWRATVRATASQNFPFSSLIVEPLVLHVEFRLRRPKSHYGTGKNAGQLKASAPVYPTSKPDTTKLLRAIEDALTHVVWRDDAQVIAQIVTKNYSAMPGAHVIIYALA